MKAVLILLLAGAAQAQVPPVINYQGQLLDASGNPASGNFTMVFSIFDVATGGTALYTETQNVTVSNGVFNVLIGSVTPIPQTLFDDSPNRLLEIRVNGNVLTPRRRFGSVPYAFTARGGNGDITAVNAGTGLAGGGTSGDVTLSLNTAFADARYVEENQANSISSTMIQNESIVNDDVGNTAAIAGTKIAPNFGSQNVSTTGNLGVGTANVGVFPGAVKYLTLSATESYIQRMAALELQGASISTTVPVARIDFSSVSNTGPNNIARIHAERGNTITHGSLVFLTHNGTALNETMRINQNGNVGIGTNQPASKLDVAGAISATDVDITKSTNATALNVQHSGLLTNPLVNIETSSSPPLGTDLLQITAGSTIAADAQFIECTSGTDVRFRVNGDGDVTADGQFTGGGADFAEMMAVSSGAFSVEAGDVLVIDPLNPRSLVKSATPRSKLVAGIYSTKPGFVGSERDWDKLAGKETASYTPAEMAEQFNEIPLAVVGIVPCKVSAENGTIRPGDLLVTSSTPGHAMRDDNPQNGTVLGKALGSLDSGTGVIKVLVTLQ
jgi:hypothetical protein